MLEHKTKLISHGYSFNKLQNVLVKHNNNKIIWSYCIPEQNYIGKCHLWGKKKKKKIRPETLQTATGSLSHPRHLSHPHRVPSPHTLPIATQSHSPQQPGSVGWGEWTQSAVMTQELSTRYSTHWHQLSLSSARELFPQSSSLFDITQLNGWITQILFHCTFLRMLLVLVQSDYSDMLILKYYKHQL